MIRWLLSRSRPLRWTALLLAAGVLGLAVMWLGIFRIPASSGHWTATDWALHYAMRQSVRTWSLGIQPPADLHTEPEIRRGAGHYATGCAPCHGAPGVPRSAVVERMTPHPPLLMPRIEHWEDRELFYIVKHGVKFTGMPAWPVEHRDDEVWSLVAFLRRMPELRPVEYRELAYGNADVAVGLEQLAEPMNPVLADCQRCHGDHGEGRGSEAFPRLDLQSEAYLTEALAAYANGTRTSGIMEPIARGLDDDTATALARHYAGTDDGRHHGEPYQGSVEEGRRIATEGLPRQRVPACVHCHGPDPVADNNLFPPLAGQPADYLAVQLELFRAEHRGGGRYGPLMTQVAQRLEDDQIRAVAEYYASLR